MSSIAPHAGNPTPKFHPVRLRGGPHDGLTVEVHQDQAELVLYERAEPHRYHRLGPKPELTHEALAGALFGGLA